ncbi:integrase_H2C2 domain-containing protein [Nephila pilipes]|uniref:Integrase_H2C2 domain-containing protein n=1 Tax=Nephila pilipes TaxID=299642 RepID=A0A8X6P2H6_NEPPI|nr:integrase_H2C2 domain-containing protein [Nephila pilipes]
MKRVQREHFETELDCTEKGEIISAASQICSLAPYLQDGLLYVKGRLEQSELMQEKKHLILLPRERFWITKGRQSVKSVLKSCLVCWKYSAKPARQQTGQLPKDRNFVASKGISWKFIPEWSPWRGGFLKRLMRGIKEPLRKMLWSALETLEELSTVLTERKSVISNRPITYDSDVLGEPRTLRPSHFLLPRHRET